MHHHDYHHGLYYSDIEPAYERPAECDCHTHGHRDACVCVRAADVDNWNQAADAVSAIAESGIDISAVNQAASLVGSAEYWNSTYATVAANSADWNQISAFDQDLYVASSTLNSAINELENKQYHVDQDTITGDGTSARPWGVSYKDQIDSLIEQYEALTAEVPLTAIEQQVQHLQDDLLTKILALSAGHIQNFDLILQLMGVVPNSANRPEFWVSAKMDQSIPTSYSDKNLLNYMYYSTYTGDKG